MIPGEIGKSTVPLLFFLDGLDSMNAYFAAKTGLLACVPYGSEKEIVWPEGTECIQCEKTKSWHWLMIISDYEKFKARRR